MYFAIYLFICTVYEDDGYDDDDKWNVYFHVCFFNENQILYKGSALVQI